MIRKCNTSNSKQNYTPYNHIRVSQFIQNQQQSSSYLPPNEDQANQQLMLNIEKIKICKQQTEQFIDQMNKKMLQQTHIILSLEDMLKKQRERSKQFRVKYHQALLSLRRKQEERQKIDRSLLGCKQRYEFFMDETNNHFKECLVRQQMYKQRINELQSIILNQSSKQLSTQQYKQKYLSKLPEQHTLQHAKEQDSTFI